MDEVKENLQTRDENVEKGLEKPESIDYGKILGDARSVFISDDHCSFSVKDAFNDALVELSKLRVTDLALEMLSKEFDTTNEDAVVKYFEKNWEKSPGMAAKYKELFDHAKNLGLRVWGIDISDQSYQERSLSDTFVERNQQWADLIADRLSSTPDAKVAVFCGSAHSGYYSVGDRANNLLARKGYKSAVVNYWGGDSNDTYLPEAKLVHDYVNSGDVKNKFMVKIPAKSRSADYMIFVGSQNTSTP